MQQYFSNKKISNTLYFNEEDLFHIQKVMKIKPSDKVIVNYSNISYMCTMNPTLDSANIVDIYKDKTNISTYIKAYIPILSDEKLSFIIEKCTELGVNEFILVKYNRCKFDINKDKIEKKLNRYRKIAKEASEQSRRTTIPIINGIINITEITSSDVNILCSLDKENVKSINKVLNNNNICGKINIAFGPEGGFTTLEEDKLSSIGYTKTSLGENVLRTETVLIVVCSIINYLKG